MCGLDKAASAPANQNCSPCTNGTTSTRAPNTLSSKPFLHLDVGDPVLFAPYWKKMSDKCRVVIEGWEFMSYQSDLNDVCYYMLPELREAIKRLHCLVGNVAMEGKHIVLGTGSTQLLHASWYALSPSDSSHPVNVVSAAPYYSAYPDEVAILRSGLYQWAGDAAVYDKDEPYIEIVTSPNNPDGTIRGPVVRRSTSEGKGKLVHDLAYYWPHYTPITHQADHDVMLFTFSKCTGHAGSRIGWAIVKDSEVAEKMTNFIHLSTIGVSRESQTRAAKILGVICDGYQSPAGSIESELFFEYAKGLMRERWEKMWEVIEQCKIFTVAKSTRAYCNFADESRETYPAFAWLKCEKGTEDCESYLKKLGILARAGKLFNAGPKFARLSMLSTNEEFDELLIRLSNAKGNSD